MILHTEKGKSGERLAEAYLIKKNFSIICSNWRFSRYEVDIIAEKNNILHFIEVKTRHSNKFGYPEQSVGRKKFRNLQKGAAAFLGRFSRVMKIQFDILSITVLPGKEIEYYFIEDFYLF